MYDFDGIRIGNYICRKPVSRTVEETKVRFFRMVREQVRMTLLRENKEVEAN